MVAQARAGAHRVGRVPAAGLIPGPLSHLSVPAEERLHCPHEDGTPDDILCVRLQAEDEEQAVSGLQIPIQQVVFTYLS